MADSTDPTPAGPLDWLKLPPVVALDPLTRRLRAAGMTPVVALLTAALIAVDDVHQAIDGWPEHDDWEWPREDWTLDDSRDVGCALNDARRALGESLVHYHTMAARRLLLATAPAGKDGAP